MRTTNDINEIRSFRWKQPGLTWGLVPTMGALHDGHLSLIKQARKENDKLGVSIFVNPIQFNNPADLEAYPVSYERDLDILSQENVDLVWIPDKKDIYPSDFQSYIEIKQLSEILEGKSRPGHFKGVSTVVAILFNVFQPVRAYFGQKDAQQLLIIKQMVKDLQFNIEIVSCPTIRDAYGLAISSRNQNLSIKGKKQAGCLYKALSEADKAILAGERDAGRVKSLIKNIISEHSLAKIDYISIANPETLIEIKTIMQKTLISLAVYIEKVRLIDNLTVEI